MIKREFIELTKVERAVLILNSGENLSSRTSPGYDIDLFIVDNVFAELWYHESTNKIVKAEIIDKDLILINYPDLINSPQVTELIHESKM